MGSVSIGDINNGRLENGVTLEPSDAISIKGGSSDEHTGTEEIIELITHGAEKVRERFSGSVLSVGDISKPGGGRLRPHRSHQSGRDADVGFYACDSRGRPVALPGFIEVRADGRLEGHPEWHFDLERNWALIEAWLSHPDVALQYVFVWEPIKEMLITYADEHHADPQILRRAKNVLEQPHGARHDNHFHIRIYCPKDDRPACVDAPPFRDHYDVEEGRPKTLDAWEPVSLNEAEHRDRILRERIVVDRKRQRELARPRRSSRASVRARNNTTRSVRSTSTTAARTRSARNQRSTRTRSGARTLSGARTRG